MVPSWAVAFHASREDWSAAANVTEAVVVAVTAVIAVFGYRSAVETVAKQNTLERIFEDHADGTVVKQRKIFRAIRSSNDDKLLNYRHSRLRQEFIDRCMKNNPLGDPQEKKAHEEKWGETFDDRQSAIFGVLNRYETFAIGISEGAIDQKLYKRWWRSSMVRDWNDARSTIEQMRKDYESPRLFIEFERLAIKWDEEMQDGGDD